MSRRAISEQYRHWLLAELEAWQASGIVSRDQTQQILDQYELPAESANRQRSRTLFVLMALAGVLVGCAVLLLIGYNWNRVPPWVKLVNIFGAMLGTYGLAFHLRYQRGMHVASELAFFLGAIFYGAGIWLVAQIFHLNAHYPDGMLWWAIGVLPLALCLQTQLLHALLVVLLATWAGMEILGFSDLGWSVFRRWGFVPNGAYLLPVLALPGIIWAYRKNAPTTAGLYVALLGWWIVLQPVAWQLDWAPIHFIGAVGALFLLVGESHRAGSPFAIPYRVLGMLLVGGTLIPLSYYELNEDRLEYSMPRHNFFELWAILLLAVATIATTWFIRRKHVAHSMPAMEYLRDIVRRQWLPLSLVLLMFGLSAWDACFRMLAHNSYSSADYAYSGYRQSLGEEWKWAAIVPTILGNIAMLGVGLWLITVGLREDRSRPFIFGVLYILLWTLLRYIDLFGDFGGMLGAALMFFLCGATFFGIAMYWRQRKEARHV